ELANWVAGGPTPMPGNYNAVGSYGMNPYDPRRDPRDATNDGRPAMQTGGSSSGIGTAANFWAANVGSETSGSILSPANQNMLAGIKPTVGRISRYGVIPITADQDTAGPMAEAIAVLKQQGAVVIDPADIPSIVDKDPEKNFLKWNGCSGTSDAKGKDADCSVILKYGMKRDFNKWLQTLGPSAPVKTLTELREWNIRHTKSGAIKYGQSNLDISDEMDVEGDKARYEADRAKDIALAGTHGIDEVMKSER